MIVHHFQGPFKATQSLTIPEEISFDTRVTSLHIECSEIQPTIMATNNPPKYSLNYVEPVRETHDIPARSKIPSPAFEIKINGEGLDDKHSQFILNAHGILDFYDLKTTGIQITMLRDLPAETSIDVFVTEIEV